MRLTLFGLVPEGCVAAECGDRVVGAPLAAPGQPASVLAAVSYPKAGRYIVRVEVSPRKRMLTVITGKE